MRAAKHTPGTWQQHGVWVFSDRTIIAKCDYGNVDSPGFDVALENARLIACAPELLSALQSITEFCDDPHGSEKGESLAMGLARLLPAARAVIAKATTTTQGA